VPTKPRPLGNRAIEYVTEADNELAAASRTLDQLDKPELPLLLRILTLDAGKRIANARRNLEKLRALRD
jgi:hypothetical protein